MPEDLMIRLGLDANGFLNGIAGVDRNVKSLSASLAQMAQGAQRQIESGMSIMTRLDLVQITTAESAKRVAEAQERYNEALIEFGPGSKQAIAANKELEAATSANEKANIRARMSYVLVAGDLLTIGTRLPQVVAGMQAMGAAALASARNLTALQVAGGAATAALAAFVAFAALSNDEVERGTTATEELALAQKALADQVGNAGVLEFAPGFLEPHLDRFYQMLGTAGMSPIHANVIFDDDLWRAVGSRYAMTARDPVEVRAFERFYRLVAELTEAFLHPGFTVEARGHAEIQRSFQIQEAIRFGRDITATYGTAEQQAKYPKPEAIQQTIESARKERDARAATKAAT